MFMPAHCSSRISNIHIFYQFSGYGKQQITPTVLLNSSRTFLMLASYQKYRQPQINILEIDSVAFGNVGYAQASCMSTRGHE